MVMPFPKIEVYDGIDVVRDDLIPGGTKLRILIPLFEKHHTIAYASPAWGGAQLALAHAARITGGHAAIFVAKRKIPHPRTLMAAKAGARVFQVQHGYLSNVQSKAKKWAAAHGAHYLQFGAEEESSMRTLGLLAKEVWSIAGPWEEVWTCAGSGVLTRGLQSGMPTSFHAVLVGRESDVGRAVPYRHPLPFEAEETNKAPFPCCPNYDRKAWQFCRRRHGPGRVLFWNVLG